MSQSLPTSGVSGASHLRLDGVSRSFPDRRVLTDVSLVVSSGEVACLIGENGSGKSTLLRIAAGLDEPDSGSVAAAGEVGLFHQEPPFLSSASVDEVLADATAPVRGLAHAVERESQALADGSPGAAARLAAAIDLAGRHHAWDLDHRIDRVIGGLGLAALDRRRQVCTLSGGQVARLSLAWLLLRSPDTLLLDEPTNHLDDTATALLVDLLRDWSGPVLIASHDRAFITEIATTIVDLDPAPTRYASVAHDVDSPGSGFGLTRFTGSLTAYLGFRREERERWAQQYRDEQAELKRLRARAKADQSVGHAERGPRTEARASKKFYADRNAKVIARRVGDAASALERLEEQQVRRPPARLRFRGFGDPPAIPRSAGPVLTATGVAVAGRLAPVSLSLSAKSRLLVTGSNGSGKSTLLEVLSGHLTPDAGALTHPRQLRIGLLSQEPLVREPRVAVRDAYRLAVGEEAAEQVPIAAFGLLAGRDLDRPVGALSVGQRRRLDLAIVLARPPDVLLLDEPTNHLSILLATELELALPGYPGAVVVASHDRWLRSGWTGESVHLPAAADRDDHQQEQQDEHHDAAPRHG